MKTSGIVEAKFLIKGMMFRIHDVGGQHSGHFSLASQPSIVSQAGLVSLVYSVCYSRRAEQSRAEQSRAEQSRAEQSRAEQSTAELRKH